jgi:hypothetical protein
MEKNVDREREEQVAAPGRSDKRRMSKLFRVLVLGGIALAVAFASAPRGATGIPEDNPSDGGDGGGTPGW